MYPENEVDDEEEWKIKEALLEDSYVNDKQMYRDNDMVNRPAHYVLGIGDTAVEVIDILRAVLTEEELRGWIRGNMIKYVLRNKFDNVQDLKKAGKLAEFL